MPGDDTVKYEACDGDALRQTEILQSVLQASLVPDQLPSSLDESAPITLSHHPYVVVMSPDCDLERDYVASNGARHGSVLPNALLVAAMESEEASRRWGHREDVWTSITRNSHPRFQFLEARECSPPDASAGDLPELVIDFRNYFTIATSVLYAQLLGETVRVCRLRPPYSHHFAQRFFNYLARIGLPQAHLSA